jgi:integrase
MSAGVAVDRRTLYPVTDADKLRQVVSSALQDDGTEVVVSRYGDAVWDFWPSIPAGNIVPSEKRLNWALSLPDGHTLLDPEHAALLASAKDFIYSLLFDPVEGRRPSKAQTIVKKLRKGLTPLLRWMVQNGYRRFVDIVDFDEYVVYVKAGSGRYGRTPAAKTVASLLAVVEDLWLQSPKLTDGLAAHPWPGESAASLAGLSRRGYHKPKTAYIPDAVARQLVQEALVYVNDKAESIVSTRAAATAAQERARARGVAHPDSLSAIAITVARGHGYCGANALRAEERLLRTACYIVISFFSGIRDAEVSSIEERCIVRETTPEGYDLWWLHATLNKTTRNPQGLPTKWIVPAIVKRAVQVLERMTRPLRTALQTTTTELEARLHNCLREAPERVALNRRLHAARQHARKLFLCRDLRSGEIVVPGTGALNRALKDFVAALDIRDDNGELWNLHSHQFRRTFARFVARHVLGDLYYLRHHFKHWSIDMTAYYANEAMDHELLGDISKTREDLQQSIVARWFDEGSPLAGGAAERLASFRSSVLTAKNRAELVSQIAEDAYIRGTGHSWCLSAPASASGSLCIFEKILCIECPNGVIDRGHVDVWREIERQQLLVLDSVDLGLPGRRRAERFLNEARKVVKILESRVEGEVSNESTQ